MSACPSCAAQVQVGDAFCGVCGQALSSASGSAGAPVKPQAPTPRYSELPSDVASANGELPADVLSELKILGTEEPNSFYLGHRLRYQRETETFDITQALLRLASLRSTALLALIFFVVPGLPGGYVVERVFGRGLAGLYSFALIAACIFIWVSPLLRRHYFPISEWKLSLDGKGASASQVFEHIADAVVRRQAPVQYRVITLPDAHSYLNLRIGRYDAYVTCMAFGQDLYIGWTLWSSGTLAEVRKRERSFLKYLFGLPYWIWLDVQSGRKGRSFDVAIVHQFDVVKAMRECLHAVTQEGVKAAVGSVPFQGSGTIGSAIPAGPAPAFAGSALTLK